jgi:hypothetical protein
LDYGWRSRATDHIQSSQQLVKSVARRANLLGPEAVKAYLATATFSQSRKEVLADHLARFYHHRGIPFDKPHYRRVEKLPSIPLTTEVDQLISNVGKKMAVFLRVLKETGMRHREFKSSRRILSMTKS